MWNSHLIELITMHWCMMCEVGRDNFLSDTDLLKSFVLCCDYFFFCFFWLLISLATHLSFFSTIHHRALTSTNHKMAAPAYSPVPLLPTPPSSLPGAPKASTPFPLPPISQSPFSALGLGFIKKFREERLSSLRPFSEFFDVNRFSKPDGFASKLST